MKLFNAWNGLSLRIIGLFVTAMLISFSPQYLHEFFGDRAYVKDEYHTDFIDDDYDWGFRHSLYFLMCVALFIVQAVRLLTWIFKNEKEFEKP